MKFKRTAAAAYEGLWPGWDAQVRGVATLHADLYEGHGPRDARIGPAEKDSLRLRVQLLQDTGDALVPMTTEGLQDISSKPTPSGSGFDIHFGGAAEAATMLKALRNLLNTLSLDTGDGDNEPYTKTHIPLTTHLTQLIEKGSR